MGKSKIVLAVGNASATSSAEGAGVSINEIAASPKTRMVVMPHEEEARRHFEAYALALGIVAHAWNYLFEKLGGLFVAVVGGHPNIPTAVWYAPDSDRTKIAMLRAAMKSSPDHRWKPERPSAKDDVKWLAAEVNALMDLRNDLIHAPCSLITDADGTSMAASPLSGHNRAKKLWGKEILVEFDWCERWTEELARFTRSMESAILWPERAWPDRPKTLDRTPKKALLARLLPPTNKKR